MKVYLVSNNGVPQPKPIFSIADKAVRYSRETFGSNGSVIITDVCDYENKITYENLDDLDNLIITIPGPLNAMIRWEGRWILWVENKCFLLSFGRVSELFKDIPELLDLNEKLKKQGL